MSTQIHVDSTWRNRNEYPNPAEFIISIDMINSWRTVDRTVQPVRPHNKMQATNMLHTVKLLNLTIPNVAVANTITNATLQGSKFVTTTTIAVMDAPFIYVSLHSADMVNDSRLVNTLEGGRNSYNRTLKDAVFVAYYDKTQNNWIQYKTNMLQSYRLDTTKELKFRLFDNTGQTLQLTDTSPPTYPNGAVQVNAVFEVTPYIRDDRYENHVVTLYDRNA